MGYVERSLADGERVVYRTRLHWIGFVWLIVLFLLTYAAFISAFDIMTQIFLVLTSIIGLWVPLMYLFSEFALTNRRVISRVMPGRFSRLPDCDEVPLIELRAVEFKLGVLGRLFDYGTVVLTDRQGVRHEFHGVPGEFYKQVEARDARVRRILR